ncbi:hypothetical protein IMZ48_34565, partial [Candidatus Bathyarchaeota archaeon]|nr:hypothetical protein [Candidatus Bathyarchaeota archaeon]
MSQPTSTAASLLLSSLSRPVTNGPPRDHHEGKQGESLPATGQDPGRYNSRYLGAAGGPFSGNRRTFSPRRPHLPPAPRSYHTSQNCSSPPVVTSPNLLRLVVGYEKSDETSYFLAPRPPVFARPPSAVSFFAAAAFATDPPRFNTPPTHRRALDRTPSAPPQAASASPAYPAFRPRPVSYDRSL